MQQFARGFPRQSPVGKTCFIEWRQVLIQPDGRGMTALGWIVMLSPLAIVFAMSFGAQRMRTGTLQLLFWAFATVTNNDTQHVAIVSPQ